jgi:Fe-S-cluster-containing hydrogenase component 2
MEKRLVVHPHHCIGCKTCEVACAFSHGKSGQPGQSRCTTLEDAQGEFVPMLCLQCIEAACTQVCPSGALKRDNEAGVVLLDQSRCVRCMACVVVCPFGNIHVDSATGAPIKCDMCSGYGDNPRCAEYCPQKCLIVEKAS